VLLIHFLKLSITAGKNVILNIVKDVDIKRSFVALGMTFPNLLRSYEKIIGRFINFLYINRVLGKPIKIIAATLSAWGCLADLTASIPKGRGSIFLPKRLTSYLICFIWSNLICKTTLAHLL
jgi:hypothetical protein